ncbi:helix-turn-helix domain-containing protein [Amycolatopsis benzoatilytica]|uniref:helix-turn-helix domain-containing protein n=1 Tax=Amycolatopsis benzoatilytica TaxID=346045 RepID=UPI0003A63D87|nr:helix-turn-helix domain-containing protein [Amycolatopsis benzoatilytica]
MSATMNFGELLRFYRLRSSLTQEELSKRTKISVRAISDMERGLVSNPQRRTVELLGDGLELAEDEADRFTDAARAGRRMATMADKPGLPGAVQARAGCALPPTLTELTGRDAELSVLDEYAQDAISSCRLQITVVHGLPGAGKTALAVTAGHRLAGRFANGALFLDLQGMGPEPLSLDRALYRLLRAFGVDERKIPAELDDRLSLYRSLQQDRSVLLVLDNAADEAQVRSLLAASNGSMVLVTSRNTLAGLDARHRLAVELLDEECAVALLAQAVGKERVAAEPEAVRRVAKMCGGVPLALAIAGNRLASRSQWTVAHLADQLEDERRRLSVLTAGDLQVRAAFEISYRNLELSVARMFRRLTLVQGPDISVELAAVVSGHTADVAEAMLEKLADASLLGLSGTCGRYTSHDLVRVFAKEQLELCESEEDVRAALDRTRHWLLAVATKAARYFDRGQTEATIEIDGPDPLHDRDSAARWLAREQSNWCHALRLSQAQGEHRRVLDLATALHWYSDLRGSGHLWLEVYGTGLKAAEALRDLRAVAEQANYLCWALSALCGQQREALVVHQRAVAAAHEVGDLVLEAWAWYYRSIIDLRLGSASDAVRHGRRAAELFEEARLPDEYHLALSLLGKQLHAAGEYTEAVAAHRQAVAHHRGLTSTPGNDELLSLLLTRLAESLTVSGDVPTALEFLDEAESLYRKHQASIGVARARHLRGLALARADRLEEARDQLMSALEEARWSETRIEILVQLAKLCEKCGEPARAREHRMRALAECSRYDAPAVRRTAHLLAADLGLSSPDRTLSQAGRPGSSG